MLKPRTGIYPQRIKKNKKIPFGKNNFQLQMIKPQKTVFLRGNRVFVSKKPPKFPNKTLHYLLKHSEFKNCINTSL